MTTKLSCHTLPAGWEGAPAQAKFWEMLQQSRRWLLLLDYDGTLAPFHQDRMQAVPYAGVSERLEALADRSQGRVVIISGRQIEDLKQLLPLRQPVEMWGSHGREHLDHDGSYRVVDLNPAERQVVDGLAKEMAARGWGHQLEHKPTALAVHWRGLPEEAQRSIRNAAEAYFASVQAPATLEMMPFESGIELRSRSRTKGQVVAEILAEEPDDAPAAFLGDDWTDEDGFAVLGERGLGILVRPEARESCAKFHLTPPGELIRFLDRWLEHTKESIA
ncbi:trehalose-phosphatase [Acidobacterium capsulatum]|nr:trehalose-phosphatase [Acidobacterium capsulatum]HCT61755.1 trehalose-phosphatase [Acidobacterium sp.]